jgi:predicted MFS family arabinose efflux permease
VRTFVIGAPKYQIAPVWSVRAVSAGRASAVQECGAMKIAKPLLLVATPIGLAIGLYEGWRLAGGLVVVMAMLIGVIGVAFASVILTIRRERREEEEKKKKESG